MDEGLAHLPEDSTLIISTGLNRGLSPSKATSVLGNEYKLIVYDAREGLNLDVLGRISGALVAAGCLLIMLADKSLWQKQAGRYQSIFEQHLQDTSVYYLEHACLPETASCESAQGMSMPAQRPFRTEDQASAVTRIDEALRQQDRCCIVLSAGRGRGKSATLGFVAARQLESQRVIYLSAPRLSVSEPLFKHLGEQLEGVKVASRFEYKQAYVQFYAPDRLLETLPQTDILMIDEAAAIPLSMLSRLLTQYPKIIFSTTTHGYEGTGRGFILKFQKLLDRVRPDWEKIELHQPIRWQQNDPVEEWIEQLLFLNIRLDKTPVLAGSSDAYTLERVDRDQLIHNHQKRASIFSLLVFAHYRTSPSDFQYLLDSEDVRLYTLQNGEQVLAVCLVNQEGGFDSKLSEAIYRGERRPRGHLLAQTLSFHAGDRQAASLRYARIMRIAVHPELQKKGLGSLLINGVIAEEKQRGMDILGSSFSASADLMRFWYRSGMTLLRLGFSRDHVTASHSAVVGLAFTSQGEQIIDGLAKKFWRNIAYWLEIQLKGLSHDMKGFLSQYPIKKDEQVIQDDWDDVYSYVYYQRNYEACYPAIVRMVKQLPAQLETEVSEILQCSLKHASNWKQITAKLRTAGRRESEHMIKHALASLVKR